MGFNLSNVKTVAPKVEKKQTELPEKLLAFVETLHGQGLRMNYNTWHRLCQAEGLCSMASVVNAGLRFVSSLPKNQQYVVTRASGKYHEKALAKWGAEAPEGFEDLPIVDMEDAVEAYTSAE